MTIIRARRWKNGKPVGPSQVIERPTDAVPEAAAADAVPGGIAGKIVRAIDRADAQGRGCSGCKAVRKTARAMVMKVSANPRR